MSEKKSLAHIRREYESKNLSQDEMLANPMEQFSVWFDEWLSTHPFEPTAMTLSTVDMQGHPDSRVVLLKEIWQEQFVFFTNYQSQKGQHIQNQPHVALLFYWPELFRQVRVKGIASFLPSKNSDEYFSMRPYESQCSAVVSPQSRAIDDMDTFLEEFQQTKIKYKNQTVLRPSYWGGYAVLPLEFEFWQGQLARFHDRFHYYSSDGGWKIERLAP